MTPPFLILASQSPRRRQLLSDAGYAFRILVPDEAAEQAADPHGPPRQVVQRLAHCKAADVAPRVDTGLVLAADTVAECEGVLLGKPRDRQQARDMLHRLRGTTHFVHSGICLWERPSDRVTLDAVTTELRMEPISDQQLDEYLATDGWQGKAGGFGLQDRLGWIQIVRGSATNVVGLPMERLQELLAPFGVEGRA